jgi:hypothetical protein
MVLPWLQTSLRVLVSPYEKTLSASRPRHCPSPSCRQPLLTRLMCLQPLLPASHPQTVQLHLQAVSHRPLAHPPQPKPNQSQAQQQRSLNTTHPIHTLASLPEDMGRMSITPGPQDAETVVMLATPPSKKRQRYHATVADEDDSEADISEFIYINGVIVHKGSLEERELTSGGQTTTSGVTRAGGRGGRAQGQSRKWGYMRGDR